MNDGKQAAGDSVHSPAAAVPGEAMEHGILERLEQLGLIDEPGMACGMLDLFLNSCRELLAKLEDSIQQASPELCRDAAHTLKGTSRNIGAVRLGDLSFDMQRCGDAGDLTDVDSLHAAAQAEFERIEQFLIRLQEDLRESEA